MFTNPITFFGSSGAAPAGYEWSHPDLRDAIAGYYAALDSTSQASDQFGGNNGTFQSGSVRDLKDNAPAYRIDGASAGITTPDVNILPTTAISIAFWVNPTTLTLWDSFAATTSNTNWVNGCGFYIYSGNEIRFFVNNWGANFAIANFSTTNDWVHVCGTWDGTTIKIYVDGVLGGTTGTFSGSITNGILRIGNGNGAYTLDGYIDDILVYNRALSASEVAELASARGYVYQTTMNFGWNFPNTETNPPIAGYLASADAGANAEDQYGTADGVLTGGVTRTVSEGLPAYAFHGFGTYIQLGAIPEVNGASRFTISAWVFRSATGTFNTIFGNTPNNFTITAATRFWFGWWNDNNIYCVNSNGSNAYAQFNSTLTGWHHLVYVFDGTKTGNAERIKLYINGVTQNLLFIGTIPSTTINVTTSNPTIGVIQNTFTSVNNLVDDVLLFDRALTGGEIAMLTSKRGIVYEPDNLPTNLTAPDHWYIASEDTGADAEDLAGTNDGVLTNGATRATEDGLSAYRFDGVNDFINMASFSPSPDTKTISVWIRRISGGADIRRILSITDGTYSNVISLYLTSAGIIQAQHVKSGTSVVDITTTTVSNQAWNHIAWVSDSLTSRKIYYNGILVGTFTASVGSSISANRLYVGTVGGAQYFNGLIDDIRIFDSALSADEIFYISRSRTQGYA